MRELVEQIKRFYDAGIYKDAHVDNLYAAGKINAMEKSYIKGVLYGYYDEHIYGTGYHA